MKLIDNAVGLVPAVKEYARKIWAFAATKQARAAGIVAVALVLVGWSYHTGYRSGTKEVSSLQEQLTSVKSSLADEQQKVRALQNASKRTRSKADDVSPRQKIGKPAKKVADNAACTPRFLEPCW